MPRWVPPSERDRLVEQLSEDARLRGESLLAAAREQAAAMLDEAHAQADGVRAEARQQGRAEGIAAAAPLAALLRAAMEEASTARQQALRHAHDELLQLALAIAAKLVDAAVVAAHGEIATAAAQEAMGDALSRPLRIRVNPADVEPVRVTIEAAGQAAPVFGDPAISLGGCVVDLEDGTIDVRIESRFAAVQNALLPERSAD